MKDLIVLVADKNMESAISGMLGRPQELGIRPISYDLFVHPRRDPGCRKEAHDFLRPFHRGYGFALVMFDHKGCGRERDQANDVAESVKRNLRRSGWLDRADAVVIAPELEAWVWAPSTECRDLPGMGRKESVAAKLAGKQSSLAVPFSKATSTQRGDGGRLARGSQTAFVSHLPAIGPES